MNQKIPRNIDPRPKRRKTKDNPYTLFTVGMQTGSPQYYVSFKMGNGHRVCLEVEREVFEVMDRFELDDLHYLNEIDNHYEQFELSEAALAKRTEQKLESIDNIILNKLHNDSLKEIISILPPIQRRRIVLHYYDQFSCLQIAQMEGCSVIAVKKTLEAARKNLKKFWDRAIPPTF